MRVAIRLAIVIVFTAATVAAQSVAPPPKPLYLRGDHWTPYDPPTEFPEGSQVYIIQKGDTLWDLAQKNLGDPYLWPQIWERNPYILDSHWIYPGDPLVIDVAVQPPVAEPQIAAEGEGGAAAALPTEPAAEGGKVTEGVPFPLGSPADVYCFAKLYPADDVFPFKITSSERIGMQDRFSEGEIMYIDGGVNQGVAAGDEFSILHRTRPLTHPISNDKMGIVYTQVGRLRVLCAQEDTAIAEITAACDPVVFGDVLLPFQPVPVPLVIAPDPSDRCDTPNGKPTGYIVYDRDDQIEIGTDWTVMTDLGTGEGIYPGMFATIFRDNPVEGMPRLVIGELGILTVEEGYSTAKVTKAWRPVAIGDRVEIK
jgi:hypothetical protein